MGHLFHKAAGLDIVYVPFKGTPETVNGLLTGSVELIYAANQIVAPLVASGQVRALAKLDRDAPPSMAAFRRSPTRPDWPISTTSRSGSGSWRPRARPADHRQDPREVVKILSDPRSGRSPSAPAISRDQHARAIRRLHSQGGGSLGKVMKETAIKFD
jgi:tripartite-type tricarboxylate transporter receptor subunit TctC